MTGCTISQALQKLEIAVIDTAQTIEKKALDVYEFSDDPVNDLIAIRQAVMNAFIKAMADVWHITAEEAYAYMLHDVIHVESSISPPADDPTSQG